MSAPSRFSLRVSVASLIVSAVLLTSLMLGAVTLSLWRHRLHEDLEQRLRELAQLSTMLINPATHASLRVPEDMRGGPYEALRQRLLEVRNASPDVHYLYTLRQSSEEPNPRFVLDTGTGDGFSPLGRSYEIRDAFLRATFTTPYAVHVTPDVYTDEYGTFLSAYAPIVRPDGSLEAVLGIDIDAARVLKLERRLLALVGFTMLAVSIFMSFTAWWLARRFTQPLRALSEDMARIGDLDLDGEVQPTSRIYELARMEESHARMKVGLRSFRKFVPRDLVAELVRHGKEATLGTTKSEVTVFFCDLAGFTRASEQLSTEALARLIPEYFAAVSDALQSHGATIDKFNGDAVMAFWNAPSPMPDHAFHAAQAAIAVAKGMDSLAQRWREAGLPELAIRIGVNSGVVQVGNVGHDERMAYTVLGDSVNLASRLESLNKHYGTRILIGEQTRSTLGDRIACRPVDVVTVKGKTKSTTVSEIAAAAPSWWPAYHAAWDRYLAQDWAGAAAAFEGIDTGGAPDHVSQILAARCRRFLTEGTPPGWSGAWEMADK